MGRDVVRTDDRVLVALVVVVAILAVRNVGGWLYLSDWAYVPVNLGLAASLVALAWWVGITRDEVGLDPRRTGVGLRYGLAVLGIVVVWSA